MLFILCITACQSPVLWSLSSGNMHRSASLVTHHDGYVCMDGHAHGTTEHAPPTCYPNPPPRYINTPTTALACCHGNRPEVENQTCGLCNSPSLAQSQKVPSRIEQQYPIRLPQRLPIFDQDQQNHDQPGFSSPPPYCPNPTQRADSCSSDPYRPLLGASQADNITACDTISSRSDLESSFSADHKSSQLDKNREVRRYRYHKKADRNKFN